MTTLRAVKTNFTAGSLAPSLYGRGDLASFENGAATLANVLIQPTGGVVRRPGTLFIDTAGGPGRLVAFTFSTEQTYLLLFTDGRVAVYRDDALVTTLAAPWRAEQLVQLSWAQSADVLLLCHPDVRPRRLMRLGEADWRIEPWAFAEEGGKVRIPFHRFGDRSVTLTPSATRGRVRFRASAPVFNPLHEGQPFRVARKAARIAAVLSPTLADMDMLEDLPAAGPTTVWDEPAFSPLRGWPVTCGFHQDRLVIGGSRDLPNRLFLSRSGDLFNFDLAEGEDDAAIEFAILSDEVNPIRSVFSGRHLQVFTTGAEWAVTGEPLTPGAIRLDRQTRTGSPADRQVPPRDVDGATLFAGSGGYLHEFLWTDLERTYQARDLAVTAGHIVNRPVELDYDRSRRLVLAVMDDGSVGALTLYRSEQVTAWTRLETAGRVLSLAVVGRHVHWLVDRGGAVTIERWEDGFALDCALSGTAPAATARWSGLGHLEGWRVGLLADGMVLADQEVAAGRLRLERPARQLQAGLRFAHVVEPLPLNAIAPAGAGRRTRTLAIGFRLEATPVLRADLGRGPVEVPLRRVAGGALTDGPAPPFTGDRRLCTLGWRADPVRPLWRIREDRPLPFTLLSTTTELKVND